MNANTNEVAPWFYYRLGDMVKGRKFRERKDGRELHYELFPDSLASQYMRETDEDGNMDVLIKLIEKRRSNLKPKKDEVVVHLRVGEVINKSEYTVGELLEKKRPFGNGYFYVKPSSFYEHQLTRLISAEKITKAVIVAGGCRTHDFTKSKTYIKKIKALFEESGLNVKTRFGHSPDDDFVYMCRSEFFIQSGGGFSRLVKRCRKIMGMRSPM
tara:strand:- start:205 stop:843 length:639 start_codon:yes stop_codon:yes gene_type:complete